MSSRRPTLVLRLFFTCVITDAMCFAQHPAPPQPLPTPAMTGPLQTAAPITFDGGPFGQLDLTGIVSGMALFQAHSISGDSSPQADLSNGVVNM
jgi:hypothetical protein